MTTLPRLPFDISVGRTAVGVLPLLASIVFVFFNTALTADVALSFVVLGLALTLHCFQAIHGRSNSAADASVFVFGLMFLLVAPIVQLSVLGYKLVNTTYAQADLLIQTNLACSLFVVAYLFGRITLFKPSMAQPLSAETEPGAAKTNLFLLASLTVLCGFLTLISVPFIGASTSDQGLTPVLLAFRRFVFFVPTAVFLIALIEFKKVNVKSSFVNVLLLLILFGFVAATENTATEKRNALGPVYLSILFVMFRPKMERKGVQVAWLVFVLLILFPLTSVFTNVPLKYIDETHFTWELLSEHFLTTHYDGWANIYSVVEMTVRNGLSGGKQLMGAALFYVPSGWWSGKPLATGIEIGNYLMTFHSMWFNNLSAPLIAEGFLDFGYLGVAAYGLVLAGVVKALEHWTRPDQSAITQATAVYFAFFLVFLLRGSLMIAVAFGSGALTAFVFVRLVTWLLNSMFAPKERSKSASAVPA